MATTHALVPFQGMLPALAGSNGHWLNLSRNSYRSREEIVLKRYMPFKTDDVYGLDGKEVVRPQTGKYIDIYI